MAAKDDPRSRAIGFTSPDGWFLVGVTAIKSWIAKQVEAPVVRTENVHGVQGAVRIGPQMPSHEISGQMLGMAIREALNSKDAP